MKTHRNFTATKEIAETGDFTVYHAEEHRVGEFTLYRAGYYVMADTENQPYDLRPSQTAEEAIALAGQLQQKLDTRRAEIKAAKEAKAKAEAERKQLEEEKGPLATPRQIDYILALIAEGKRDEGGFYYGPTDRDGISELSRQEASLYIDSLKGNY